MILDVVVLPPTGKATHVATVGDDSICRVYALPA
jgi:hypothetical protein